MSKYHFLKYNDEKVVENSETDFGWRNPISDLENGIRHVITGNINYIKDKDDNNNILEVGDTVYLYCGGTKRTDNGRSGIYGRGKIVDFLIATKLDYENGDGNLKFALIKLDTNLGIDKQPLLSYKDGIDYLKDIVISKSTLHNWGHCILTDEEVKLIEDGIANTDAS